MKRKTPVKLIGYLLCVALLCGLLAGCGNDKVQEDQNDNVSADTIPEDVVVHTDYAVLAEHAFGRRKSIKNGIGAAAIMKRDTNVRLLLYQKPKFRNPSAAYTTS